MSGASGFQQQLDAILCAGTAGESLLLHSCCAPCSSYVLEYLSAHYPITVFYFNPNIVPSEEYTHRLAEQRRLCAVLPTTHPVSLLEGDYNPAVFSESMRGTEQSPEGGERCRRCIAMRLRETAEQAAKRGFSCFTTTLTISPHKDAHYINECGTALGAEYGVRFLPSDFKKRGGFQRSIQLSKAYGLYRQDFCGCAVSMAEATERRRAAEKTK